MIWAIRFSNYDPIISVWKFDARDRTGKTVDAKQAKVRENSFEILIANIIFHVASARESWSIINRHINQSGCCLCSLRNSTYRAQISDDESLCHVKCLLKERRYPRFFALWHGEVDRVVKNRERKKKLNNLGQISSPVGSCSIVARASSALFIV